VRFVMEQTWPDKTSISLRALSRCVVRVSQSLAQGPCIRIRKLECQKNNSDNFYISFVKISKTCLHIGWSKREGR
jgi:hypothetical protein